MNRLCVSLVTIGLLGGVCVARAEHDATSKSSQRSAAELLGKKVINTQNDEIGKMQDIIVNFESSSAPYAIIQADGGSRSSRAKIAVPLSSLKYSSDGKFVILAATRDQLQAASKTPTSEWTQAGVGDWTRRVDGYYGRPVVKDREMRDKLKDSGDTRTFVRDPQPKGGELLLTPQDVALCEKVGDALETTYIRTEGGTVHLYGTVSSEEARKEMELKARSVPGVAKVESHLKVKGK